MPDISPQHFQRIVALISPFVTPETARRALVERALGTDPAAEALEGRLDFTLETEVFAPQLVRQLLNIGEMETGQPALVAVLQAARAQANPTQQADFDAVMQPMQPAPTHTGQFTNPSPRGRLIFVAIAFVGALGLAVNALTNTEPPAITGCTAVIVGDTDARRVDVVRATHDAHSPQRPPVIVGERVVVLAMWADDGAMWYEIRYGNNAFTGWAKAQHLKLDAACDGPPG